MIMLTYSMQIAATSVAMEKEEKTLETLLTVPVDRFAILMGKLVEHNNRRRRRSSNRSWSATPTCLAP